jgi:hypothetical protein
MNLAHWYFSSIILRFSGTQVHWHFGTLIKGQNALLAAQQARKSKGQRSLLAAQQARK